MKILIKILLKIWLPNKLGSKTMKETKTQGKKNELEDIRNSNTYKKAIDLFPDLEIINIKNLEEDSNEWF